ncbi:MAG TPA: hypothetical protein VFD90_00135 [Gaiellales bacterium]|nr:hypothetical protein [Gaiellales bacterium]
MDASGVVMAAGPLDKSVIKVTEMCVWVIQHHQADDAIGNAMGPPYKIDDQPVPMPPGHPMHEGGLQVWKLGTDEAHWLFPLMTRFKSVPWSGCSATAMAIGVFEDRQGVQSALWWSEAVRLEGPGAPPC